MDVRQTRYFQHLSNPNTVTSTIMSPSIMGQMGYREISVEQYNRIKYGEKIKF